MKTPVTIYLIRNGTTVAFDANGEQIGELQQSWILLFIDFLKEKGLTGQQIEQIEIKMPDQRSIKYISKYDNWSFKPKP